MATQTSKQTPADARKAALASDFAPLYAVAGVTDLVASTVRDTLADTQVKANAETLINFIGTLPEQAKTLPEQFKTWPEMAKAQLTEAQKRAESYLGVATNTYGDLAGRGKRAVDAALVTAKLVQGKADEVFDEAVTEAAETVTEATGSAKPAPAKKAPAKKTTAKKATAKKAPAKKAADTAS